MANNLLVGLRLLIISIINSMELWTPILQNLDPKHIKYCTPDGRTKIFSVWSDHFGEEVMVKQTLCRSPEEVRRHVTEGEVAHSHPDAHICECLHFSQEPDPVSGATFVYVVMKKLPKDLDKDIGDRVSNGYIHMPEAQIWKIAKDLVTTLGKLQCENITHRDIKPQNILLDYNGEVKLCDFGFAKKVDPSVPQIHTVNGTLLFLSPKLRHAHFKHGREDVHAIPHNVYKSDVYSLGVTLLYLSLLESPGSTDNMRDLQRDIESAVSNISNYSQNWVGFLHRMLVEDEEDRPDFLQLKAEMNDPRFVWRSPVQVPDDEGIDSIPVEVLEECIKVSAKCGYSQVRVSPTLYEEVPCMVSIEGANTSAEYRCGADIVCVIDVSGSMIPSKMNLVKRTLSELTSALNRTDRMSIVTFNEEARKTLPLTACNSEGRLRVLEAIETLKGGGATNISAGFTLGVRIIAERGIKTNSASLLLFSDGENNRGPDPLTVCRDALLQVRSDLGVTIHTFGYQSEIDTKLLTTLAEEGNGEFHAVKSVQDIEAVFMCTLANVTSVVARDVEVHLTCKTGENIDFHITKVFSKEENGRLFLPYITANTTKDMIFLLKPGFVTLARPQRLEPVVIDVTYVEMDGTLAKKSVNLDVKFVPWEGAPKPKRNIDVVTNMYRVIGADVLRGARTLADNGDFPSADRMLTLGIAELSNSGGFERHPMVANVIGDLEDAKKLVRDKHTWEQGGDPHLASISYSHYSQRATVGSFQYASQQQKSFCSRFGGLPKVLENVEDQDSEAHQ